MNRNHYYGTTSNGYIDTVHLSLQEVCHEAMRIANTRKLECPDFGISRGLTTQGAQFNLYLKGRNFVDGEWVIEDITKVVTHCDGHVDESNHQRGIAVDFFAIINGKANYEPANLALVATCFFEAAHKLGVQIRWGGNYRSIIDAPHIELVL